MKTLIIGFFLVLSSCSKELKYTKEKLLSIAVKADPSVSFILPKNLNDGPSCVNYSDQCLSVHTVRVKNLEMIAVEFFDEAHAIKAAKKYRGYYARNWFFDDVSGEPVLERFIEKELDAKKP